MWLLKDRRRFTFLLVCFLVLSFFVPYFRKTLLDIFKYPLKINRFLLMEFKALVFFHNNFLENIRLEKEIGLLKQKLIDQEELLKENKRLKEMLSFRQDFNFPLIPARVIMRSSENWSSLVVIDRGKKDKIKENFAVISPSGLVGRIVEVGDSTSKVLLLTDPESCVSAIIQESRYHGLVCGTLENYLVMRYLDEDVDVKINDKVITAGLTEIFPKGILIGEVMEIKREYHQNSIYLKIKPSVDFNRIEEVMVILK